MEALEHPVWCFKLKCSQTNWVTELHSSVYVLSVNTDTLLLKHVWCCVLVSHVFCMLVSHVSLVLNIESDLTLYLYCSSILLDTVDA